MNAAAISLQNVRMSYGQREVISGIDLTVRPGSSFGLIGLNGVGKTTLIKAMAGLRTPDSGTVRISGHDPAMAAGRKEFAYLPERFDPPFFLTGSEFLRFSQSLHGTAFNRDETAALASALALEAAALDNRIHTYSKGMRQKLGLMSVLLTPCPLLILDEPMSGLDPLTRGIVRETLQKEREKGRSVFLSSHILADMAEICDHVAVLHGGRLVFDGSPAGLMDEGGDRHNMEKAFLNILKRDKAA